MDYSESLQEDISRIMLDLQRIIVLCLPSLLFAATMEPGKQFKPPALAKCSYFSPLVQPISWCDCFKVFLMIQYGESFILRQLVELARVQYLTRSRCALRPWANFL